MDPSEVKLKIRDRAHFYGFTDIETRVESYHRALVKILLAINYDYSRPLIVYLMKNHIRDLEEVKHTDIDFLNDVGITIYLNEPVSVYTQDGILKAEELDSILTYIENNKLTNVTVYTCDYRCEELLTYYTSYMKLITDDVFLKTIINTRATLPQDQFTKKFINLNWRYTEHRHLTAAFMTQCSSNCSWKYIVKDSVLDIYKWSNIGELDNIFNGKILAGLEYLKQHAPLVLDINNNAEVVEGISSTHDVYRLMLNKTRISDKPQDIEKFYADSFCDIVTETKYDQTLGNISEKTFKPIGYLKPFILVAPPRCLEYLRTMGYKTFSDYWDESYDLEPNSHKRLIKIFKLIETINEKSIDELKQLYNDMLPVLTHNYNLSVEQFPNQATRQKINSANTTLRKTIWKYKSNSGLRLQ